MLLHFHDERGLAHRVAKAAGVAAVALSRHRFPDGEIKVTLPPRLPRRVALLRSLHQPNDKLVELLLVAQAARDLGAREVTLVAPYLWYMRQDRAFAPGEAVSQRHVGGFLAALFDRLITVDPHLHRVATLDEIVPGADAVALSAAPLIGRYLRAPAHRGAAGWARTANRRSGWRPWREASGEPWAVCRKQRRGDRAVGIQLPPVSFRGRRVVIVDDVASTGHTLAETARAVRAAGATRVDVAVTHALFADDAAAALAVAGVQSVWSTDSMAHPTNAIGIAALVGRALRPRR